MKKLALTLSAVLFSFIGFAQDMETAVNSYNEAATLVNEGNLSEALAKFLETRTMALALGEEAVNVVNDCQDIIPQIYMKLGEAAAEESDFDKAIENFRNVIATATEYDNNADAVERASNLVPKMLMAKGGALLNKKEYAAAALAFNEVAEADPSNGIALLRLGMCVAASGDVDSAVVVYNRAAEISPNVEKDAKKQIANIYLKKAMASQKAKDSRSALQYAQLSAEANDTDNAQKLIGLNAYNLKQWTVAIAGFEAYLSMKPGATDKVQILYQLGESYKNSGDNAKACGYFKQIVDDPKFGESAKYMVTDLKCK
ncbi:MAG: tetratricopeptide repeat protein [Bacteroidales bacterium]|nr:tetratricopeptide repeat protein [Bacteroidales bacterium]